MQCNELDEYNLKVYEILVILGYHKFHARWIPKQRTDKKNHFQTATSQEDTIKKMRYR